MEEPLGLTVTEKTFQIQGFPDAEKIVAIEKIRPHHARRLADLTLHRFDLECALKYTNGINLIPNDPPELRNGLWFAAIVRYMKCFGQSKSRFKLDPKRVYKDDSIAAQAYAFFDGLRHKHLVHDENAYARSLPGAILNKRESSRKIAKVICVAAMSDTLDQNNFSGLHLLITRALDWISKSTEELFEILTRELEKFPYCELHALDSPVYFAPTPAEVNTKRS